MKYYYRECDLGEGVCRWVVASDGKNSLFFDDYMDFPYTESIERLEDALRCGLFQEIDEYLYNKRVNEILDRKVYLNILKEEDADSLRDSLIQK